MSLTPISKKVNFIRNLVKILSCKKPTEQSTAGQQLDGYLWLGGSILTIGFQIMPPQIPSARS